MTGPDDSVVVVNGPTVEVSEFKTESELSILGVMYSVHLMNGLVVTAPDRFPPSGDESPERQD